MTVHELAPAGSISTSGGGGAQGQAALRIGDLERAEAESALGQALALGQLDRTEFDERLGAIVVARTGGDIASQLADLPVTGGHGQRPSRREARAVAARRGLVVHAASVAAALIVMVTVWLLTALMAGAWYPWPIWPLLGGLVGVGSHGLAIGGLRHRTSR